MESGSYLLRSGTAMTINDYIYASVYGELIKAVGREIDTSTTLSLNGINSNGLADMLLRRIKASLASSGIIYPYDRTNPSPDAARGLTVGELVEKIDAIVEGDATNPRSLSLHLENDADFKALMPTMLGKPRSAARSDRGRGKKGSTRTIP